MNGDDIIDAVAARLGMKAATEYTTPSRDQILEWVNEEAKLVALEFGEAIPELYKVQDESAAVADMIKPLAVTADEASPVINATQLPGTQFTSEKANRDSKKIAWSWDPATPGKIRLTSGTQYTLEYIVCPGAYTDAAAEPSPEMGPGWVALVVKRASIVGFLANRETDAAAVLKGKAGS